MEVKCNAGHVLKSYVTTGGSCDICTNSEASGTLVMDCRKCNYWLCVACHSAAMMKVTFETSSMYMSSDDESFDDEVAWKNCQDQLASLLSSHLDEDLTEVSSDSSSEDDEDVVGHLGHQTSYLGRPLVDMPDVSSEEDDDLI